VSYLNGPRLVFSGSFEADVSTVNNDVRHYDNATFEPRFQQPQSGAVQNGWWNPSGGSAFRFVGCTVRSVAYADGSSTADPADEPLVGKLVSGPGDRSSGKLVDIDPQMQMTSELWGVALRLYDEEGGAVLEGDLLPTGFRDLQTRQVAQQSRNGQPLGASWTSVLTGLRWGPAAEDSRLLRELREATEDDLLAVHLTAFGYYYAHADGRFSLGRLLGVVGPYRSGEPRHFAAARRLVAPPQARVFAYGNFLFDEEGGRLTLDLGGSFPIADPEGTVADLGTLRVAVARDADVPLGTARPTIRAADRVVIGEVDYGAPDWLAVTAGIAEFAVDGEAATLLRDHQLLLLGAAAGGGGADTILAAETTGGLAVRADQNVQRLDPGETARVDLYARQWGRPLPSARIALGLARPSQSGGGSASDPDPPRAEIPFTNHPADALSFPASLTTDADGRAALEIEAGDPHNPRAYIDGQIYQLLYRLDGLPRDQQYFLDQVVVHLRDAFEVPERPTWEEVRPILTQFGNLYPLMSRHIVDLSDRQSVLGHRGILLFAFTRELGDPVYMPVTRDLSAAKLATVVRWLEQATKAEEGEEEPAAAVRRQRVPSVFAATARAPAAAARRPGQPSAEELARPAAVEMSRERFEEMTRGEGGKVDALKNAAVAVDLVEE
jgi:hypothetical protein